MIFDVEILGRSLRVEARSHEGRYEITVDGRPVAVDVVEGADGFMSLLIDGRSHEVGLERSATGFRAVFPDDSLDVALEAGGTAPVARKAASGPVRVLAPMPGRIVRVLVEAGEPVEAGQGLVVMEAMKMENEIRAPRPGRVRESFVREGQAVDAGAALVVLE